MNMNIIKIVYHNDNPELTYIDGKSDWIDLYVGEDVEMKKGDFKLIDLGVSMKLLDGYEAHVVPRSSTFKKYGVLQANGIGIIDNSYSGTNDVWKFPAFATRDTIIHKGDRICQFRLFKNMETVTFKKQAELDNQDRLGFGSTGV